MPAGSHLVPHRHRHPQAQGRDGGAHHRPGDHPQKDPIERAYRIGEALGLQVWCQDEAGPYQAIPHLGASWQPEGHPACLPHEYLHGGTAKLLTLFRPATGEVRAEPVPSATNAVLHPWLKRELAAILATCPAAVAPTAPGRHWSNWSYRDDPFGFNAKLPPLRVLLIWDNLKGHHPPELVDWCLARGIWLLYTPIAGSWLNMAESLQRILVRRALAGQHPTTAVPLMDWLAQAVRGWNTRPDALRVGWQARGSPGAGTGAAPLGGRLRCLYPTPHPPAAALGHLHLQRRCACQLTQ